MLRLRVLSAVVGVPFLLGLAIAGGAWYLGLAVFGAIVASLEVFGMLSGAGYRPATPLGLALAVAIVLSAALSDARVLPAALILAMLGGLGWMMLREDTTGAILDWGLTLASALYVGGTLFYAVPLRALSDGLFWVLGVMVCTWVCDIAAFFVGRRWGRRKLAPRLSPGKSVEGAIGGLVGTIVAAILLGPVLAQIFALAGYGPFVSPSVPRLIGFGLVVGVCAIIGDLMESFIKRQCGAKDSGVAIPGHGGVLDRIDSLLVAVVGAYFYVVATS